VRGQRHVPAAPYPGKDPVPIVQEAEWASGSVWPGAENLAPTGIRSPDRPARRQSLYRIRYPARKCIFRKSIFEQSCRQAISEQGRGTKHSTILARL